MAACEIQKTESKRRTPTAGKHTDLEYDSEVVFGRNVHAPRSMYPIFRDRLRSIDRSMRKIEKMIEHQSKRNRVVVPVNLRANDAGK